MKHKLIAIVLLVISISAVLFYGVGNHGHFMFRPNMMEDWLIWGIASISGLIGLNKLVKQPKKITITNKAELISTMTRIVEILRDNGFSAQADAVRRPLQYLYSDDIDKFLFGLNTVDIWGGSGSAWEVIPFQSEQVEKEFQSAFVKLIDLMEESGIENKKARSIKRYFLKILKRHD